jgi:hypothetical protein
MNQVGNGRLSETIEGVTHRAHWFVDNHAVVLRVGSSEPLSRMLVGLLMSGAAERVAIRLFHEYLAGSAAKRTNP